MFNWCICPVVLFWNMPGGLCWRSCEIMCKVTPVTNHWWGRHARFITTDELEAAMMEYGIADESSIKDILSEVDTDNVSIHQFRQFSLYKLRIRLIFSHPTGWTNQLWWILRNDEKRYNATSETLLIAKIFRFSCNRGGCCIVGLVSLFYD